LRPSSQAASPRRRRRRPTVAALVRAAKIEERHRAIATALMSGERRAVWLGALALRHAAFADLRALAAALARITGSTFGVLAEGGNAAGAYLAGAVPHRIAGGRASSKAGLSAWQMLKTPLSTYVLFGVEPWEDALDPECMRTLAAAQRVIAITPFASAPCARWHTCYCPWGPLRRPTGPLSISRAAGRALRALRQPSAMLVRAGRSCVCSATPSRCPHSSTKARRKCAMRYIAHAPSHWRPPTRAALSLPEQRTLPQCRRSHVSHRCARATRAVAAAYASGPRGACDLRIVFWS
jgi:hypothetical protein